jgi:hypothetical protein
MEFITDINRFMIQALGTLFTMAISWCVCHMAWKKKKTFDVLEARVFITGIHFHPSLIFADKPRSLSLKGLHLGRLWACLQQRILKGEILLYCWPPVWLVWISLFWNYKQKLSVIIQLIPNQSNRRWIIQWYFPL